MNETSPIEFRLGDHMWLRLRLDIGWSDLIFGFLHSLCRVDRQQAAQQRLQTLWSDGRNDALACLCVRSGFDLLLSALDLPRGSHVLFSAVTIPDMPRIAEEHGLVPVPVDVCRSNYRIDVDALQQAMTDKARLLVVAHLFGGRPDLHEVLAVARERNLLVVEDCAQAWCGRTWRGNPDADASLFSFGAIKTATALGGALCRVRDPNLLARMRTIQTTQPVQHAGTLPLKFCRFALLKAVSSRIVFAGITRLAAIMGSSIDNVLQGLTRGFSGGDLVEQLRRRPCAGLLMTLEHRVCSYDSWRIDRRMSNARRIIANLDLDLSQPELTSESHSFWLFPLMTANPAGLIAHLRRHGFDTTQRGSLEVVPPPPERPELTCLSATKLLQQTLFLPCYPEITSNAIDRMCDLIREYIRHLHATREPDAPAVTC